MGKPARSYRRPKRNWPYPRRKRRRAVHSWWFPWAALAGITVVLSYGTGSRFDVSRVLNWSPADAFDAIRSIALEDTATSADSRNIVGQASVIDGDTIEIHGQRIRFHGIDAPESQQLCDDARGKPYRCGQKAALALSDKIARRTVSCEPRDKDRYGRIVAICRVGAADLNAWLVSEGLAVAFRRYSHDYVSQEASAQAGKRGIWAGRFTEPSEWRRTQRK